MSDNALLLGETLKEIRISKNVTVEQLSQELKISKNIINALEEGESFKDNTYMRLIIKKYAKYLNIDEAEFISLLDKAYPSVTYQTMDLSKNVTINKKKTKMKKNKKRRSFLGSFLLTLIFIVFILILIFLTSYNITSSVKETTTNETTTNETTLISNTTLKPSSVEKAEQEPTNKVSLETVSDNEIDIDTGLTKDFKFKIVATDSDVYTDLSVDEAIQESETIPQGESKTYDVKNTDKDNTIINIGNINACDIYVNDEKVSKDEYVSSQQYISFK